MTTATHGMYERITMCEINKVSHLTITYLCAFLINKPYKSAQQKG